jgi:hypothetical protein
MQVAPAPPLQQAFTGALSWLGSSGRAAAAVALLALPLLAVVRPFKAAQLPPAGVTNIVTNIIISSSSSSSSSSSGEAAGAKQRRVQPVNSQISAVELQQLCSTLQQQLQGQIWLRENVPGLEELLPPGSGSTNAGSTFWDLFFGSTTAGSTMQDSSSSRSAAGIVYQVVVNRCGQVLGLKPCSPLAAAAFLKLPLAASLRGPELAKVQEK